MSEFSGADVPQRGTTAEPLQLTIATVSLEGDFSGPSQEAEQMVRRLCKLQDYFDLDFRNIHQWRPTKKSIDKIHFLLEAGSSVSLRNALVQSINDDSYPLVSPETEQNRELQRRDLPSAIAQLIRARERP